MSRTGRLAAPAGTSEPGERPGAPRGRRPGRPFVQTNRPVRELWAWTRAALGHGAWRIAGLCVLQGAMSVIVVSYALLMSNVVDSATAGDAPAFVAACVAFGVALVVQVGLSAAQSHVVEKSRGAFDNALRATVFSALLGGDETCATRHTGDLMSVLTSDVTVVTSGLTSLPMTVVSMVVRMVGVLAVMALIAPGLALLFLVAGGTFVVGSTLLRRRIGGLHLCVQEAEAQVRSFMQECLEGVTVIRAFGVEGKVGREADALMSAHLRERMHKNDVSTLATSGFNLAMQVAYLVGFVWCGHGILVGMVTAGTLVAVTQLVGQIRGPLASASGIGLTLASACASVERLMEAEAGAQTASREVPAWLRGEGGADSSRGSEALGESAVTGAGPVGEAWSARLYAALETIRFEGVTFEYAGRAAAGSGTPAQPAEDTRPDAVRGRHAEGARPHVPVTTSAPLAGDTPARPPVLARFSAEVPKGSFTVVTGPSGVGKSTLLMLLMGLRRPTSGRVALACADGRSVDVSTLPAGMFAYVPQGNGLMSGTIAEAVAFSERGPVPNMGRVREACRAASAAEFVERLPHGYETMLGEHGHGLSEGQMQRLAVARALYSGAPILVLDESTSALDADTECRLLDSIRSMSDVTVFIVTHRPQAVSLCDQELHLGGRTEGSH
ncbi:ABC transporter ATP-binding protein [Olsenella uli]|uniref:ABC transporter ATP-binding protein n=1 Tax=Olsenella uli TaxID=133926 RepID=UPI0012ABC583|nr:ABC transporter ATP-binding protein [Olsenella uli]